MADEERPGAGRWVPDHASLGQLRKAAQDRRGCELYRDATQVVMGRGALEDAGIDPADTYWTNVVKHFRWRGTRGKRRIHQSPTQQHVTACSPWLVAELRELQPVGVVLLGGTAGKAVYGSKFKVGEARGQLVDWPERFQVDHPPGWVLPTTHPSAVLRAEDRDAVYAGLVADLEVAASALTG